MPSALPKIEIKCPAVNMAEIYVDGYKLPAVRNISAFMPLDEVPYVQVEIITADITLEGIGELKVVAKDVVAEKHYIATVARRVIELLRKRGLGR